MQRMAMVIGLKGDKVVQYKQLHANAWPEILDQISKYNIQNYSIFLKEPETCYLAIGSTPALILLRMQRKWRNIQRPGNGGI